MRILVKVTKDVLERSKMCDKYPHYNCAISVALRDLFLYKASFGRIIINFHYDKLSSTPLPQSATNFIDMFDKSTPEQRVNMTPFSFELEVPEYVIEKIGISTIYKVLSESSTLQMVM